MFESLVHHIECVSPNTYIEHIQEIETEILTELNPQPIYDRDTNEWEDYYHV